MRGWVKGDGKGGWGGDVRGEGGGGWVESQGRCEEEDALT